ncbi:MAG: hypothetical protein HP023_10870 [Lachnospiraceae bacterium]|nr:hypothetical protein [Lachnospiraceae bacterium]
MATKTESTAHAAATANQEEVWDKIMQYKAAVQILKTLLAERKITEEDYRRVHGILAKECDINSCSIFLDSCPIIR